MTPPVIALDAHVALGAAGVVAGGLIAAITGPLDLAAGSWTAAYLVLVCGVPLCAIGVAQQRLAGPPRIAGRPVRAYQLAAWAVANTLVVVGALTGKAPVTVVGSALLLATLAVTARIGSPLVRRRGAARRVAAWLYLGLLAVLAASVPVGVVLATVG